MVEAFRFDPGPHEYIDTATGAVLPHITGMLEATGWIDDTWYTEESSDRGQAVHALTRDYDLDALDVATCHSPFRGYLLAHVKATGIFRPQWIAIEEPQVHPRLRFGGRPDRVGRIYGAAGVLEVKSGDPEKSHAIQTALQAILAADDFRLPADTLVRYALYLKDTGKFRLEQHKNKHDLDKARDIIRSCCGAF